MTATSTGIAHGKARVALGQPQRSDRRIYAISVATSKKTSQSMFVRACEILYRAAEFVVALLALLITSPIMLLEALVIKLDSPGPILFFHTREAQSAIAPGCDLVARRDLRAPNGEFEPDRLYYVPQTFRFVKFRTMYQDAAQRHPEFYWWNYDVSPQEFQNMHYKLENDPRVTRAGRWLRRSSLDELPNLWSVLTGHMRLVGPRPEAPQILPYYTPEQMTKFTVKPGITCLSKIHGRGNLSVQEQIAWDLDYVRNRTLLLDLKILFLTFWLVLTGKGAF